MKAYKVTIDGISAIAFAGTRSRAKWICVRAYWDAGFGKEWPAVKAVRCPAYDNHPFGELDGRAWSEDFLNRGREPKHW